MSPTFAVEETIPLPPEAVWAALTNWEHAHRWMRGIDWMRAEGETAAGTRLTFHTRGKERSSHIIRCDPGRALVLRSVQGGVTADYSYELHPLDGGHTRITLVADCRSEGVMWKLLSPLIGLAIRWTDGGQLTALKALAAPQ